MITLDEAKQMRERFYEGGLSQAEVRQLARFMASESCPDEWRAERPLFALTSADEPLPEGFTERLAATVMAAPVRRRSVSRRLAWRAVVAVTAACVAFALWLGVRKPHTERHGATPAPVAATKPDPIPAEKPAPEAQPADVQTVTAETPPAPMRHIARRDKRESTAVEPQPLTAENTVNEPSADTNSIYVMDANPPAELDEQLYEMTALIQEMKADMRSSFVSLHEAFGNLNSEDDVRPATDFQPQ